MQLDAKGEVTMTKARKAYEGYCRHTNWRSLATGDKLPEWVDLPSKIRNAWFAAISSIEA